MANLMTVSNLARQFEGRTHPELLAKLAWQALVAEAELTPKPGLVDRRGSGSHTDLSLDLMLCSARAIGPYFQKMAASATEAHLDQHLRAKVAAIGRDAEAAMLRATYGSNAHRGAIWVLGLLVSAASCASELGAETIASRAGCLARYADNAQLKFVSHGEVARIRYGATGARGEAYANFPHIWSIALPALRKARREGRSERESRLMALLEIMSRLDDTCVLHRGGPEALKVVHEGAFEVLSTGGPGCLAGDAVLLEFDRTLVGLGVSPGGSADLLAGTLFLDALERGQSDVQRDNSSWEDIYGAD
jgi:triphosphoribosyl-dephospho-CoA synthase